MLELELPLARDKVGWLGGGFVVGGGEGRGLLLPTVLSDICKAS